VDLRTEFGTRYDDPLCADLDALRGRPVAVAPWRLVSVVVMQSIDGLTDRQAADAVRRGMAWQDALSLDWTDAGFDVTLLHDVRQRLRAHQAAQRLLDPFLSACKARGWLKGRGTQRTDATHVLAAIRQLPRWACVLEAMPHALHPLGAADPAWVRQQGPLAWYDRDGLRADRGRLPKETSKRDALALQIGAEGYQLLDEVWRDGSPLSLRDLPALEVLRQIWLQPDDCRTVLGLEERRWRPTDERPPSARLIPSPYDVEARYTSKREPQWVGDKVHLTETCDAGQPELITPGLTTPATTPDGVKGTHHCARLRGARSAAWSPRTRQRRCRCRLPRHGAAPVSARCGGTSLWVLSPPTSNRPRR
jgi:transposase